MSSIEGTLFMSAKLYCIVFDCSERTAYRRMKEIRAFLKKSRKQKLTVKDVAHVEGIELNYMIEVCRIKTSRGR